MMIHLIHPETQRRIVTNSLRVADMLAEDGFVMKQEFEPQAEEEKEHANSESR